VREGNINTWKESSKVASACCDYTAEPQWTEAYDQLLTRLADEVFHIIFPNRALLSRIHEVLAIYVQQQDPESFADDSGIARLFKGEGRLERVPPPQWAKHAIAPAPGRVNRSISLAASSTSTRWTKAVTSPPGRKPGLFSEELRAAFRPLR
jgi:hypothetical protein